MPPTPVPPRHRLATWLPAWLPAPFTAAVTALLTACGIAPSSPTNEGNAAANATVSVATTPMAYRQDAARHVYQRNAHRIFQGTLPPMLQAVGVLEVNLDRQGRVRSLNWLRAPRHAPEVMREIERTAREAAPYPVAQRLGYVTYTDTWLWHASGKFQLDTLTEGQR